MHGIKLPVDKVLSDNIILPMKFSTEIEISETLTKAVNDFASTVVINKSKKCFKISLEEPISTQSDKNFDIFRKNTPTVRKSKLTSKT